MKKLFIAFAICLASIQLLHAQAQLPSDATKTPTREEQELLDLSKTKWGGWPIRK